MFNELTHFVPVFAVAVVKFGDIISKGALHVLVDSVHIGELFDLLVLLKHLSVEMLHSVFQA